MSWIRTDPVQDVVAMLVTTPQGVGELVEVIHRRSALLGELPVELGEGWAAVFTAPLTDADGFTDRVLPRLTNATALYEAAPECWMPIGLAMKAPAHVLPALWRMILDRHRVEPPLIMVPRISQNAAHGADGDIYLVRNRIAFKDSPLNRPRLMESDL